MKLNQESGSSVGEPLQVVAWKIGQETYAMDIANIFTVIAVPSITPVPQTPTYVRGVINLRGQILPVIDFRARFGLPDTKPTPSTRIIVIHSDELQAGIVVDSVNEVLKVQPETIESSSHWLSSTGNKSIIGVGKITEQNSTTGTSSERLIILLDPNEMLTGISAGLEPELSVAA